MKSFRAQHRIGKTEAEYIEALEARVVALQEALRQRDRLIVEHHAARTMVVGERCPVCAKAEALRGSVGGGSMPCGECDDCGRGYIDDCRFRDEWLEDDFFPRSSGAA